MKKDLKKGLLLLFFALTCIVSTAQEQKSQFWSHVSFGGAIGLSFGDGFFSGTLAPSGIYHFDEQFALGTGINISYATEKDFYESTILGGSIIFLYNVIPQLQLSTEFEALNVNRNYDSRIEDDFVFIDENYLYPALFLGAGYNSGPVTFGLRVDVLYDSYKSVYSGAFVPFVRVFF